MDLVVVVRTATAAANWTGLEVRGGPRERRTTAWGTLDMVVYVAFRLI